MEDQSDYEIQMSKLEHRQNHRTQQSTSLTDTSPHPSPNTKESRKNPSIIFNNANPYIRSSFCNLLNQQFPKGKKINPTTSSKELIETIQAMVEEGILLDDKMMDEVLTNRDRIAQAEDTFT